jgi:hypothetical protein
MLSRSTCFNDCCQNLQNIGSHHARSY